MVSPSEIQYLAICTVSISMAHIKFMQVEGHVKCMCTNFGGRGLSHFRDFAPPSNLPFRPRTMIVHVYMYVLCFVAN